MGTTFHRNFMAWKFQVKKIVNLFSAWDQKTWWLGPRHSFSKKDFVPGTQPPIYTIIMYIGGWVPGTESQKKRFCARDPTTNI